MEIGKDKWMSTAGSDLRRRAEEHLNTLSPEAQPSHSEFETLRLLHELQVHRIELEMQNAELRRTIDEREKTEMLLGRYADLYDYAPVGYLTLARTGKILAANLTCAGLLDIERPRLLNRQFQCFVTETGFSSFTAFLDSIFDNHGKQTCEVTLQKVGGEPLCVRVEAAADESREECRLALIDISVQKQLQDEVLLKIGQLESALALVKQLEGVIPICSYCKKIRDDKGSWHQMEKYITEHSEALFNHGVCDECYENQLSEALNLKKVRL